MEFIGDKLPIICPLVVISLSSYTKVIFLNVPNSRIVSRIEEGDDTALTGVSGVRALTAHGIIVETICGRVIKTAARICVMCHGILQPNTRPTPHHDRQPRRL